MARCPRPDTSVTRDLGCGRVAGGSTGCESPLRWWCQTAARGDSRCRSLGRGADPPSAAGQAAPSVRSRGHGRCHPCPPSRARRRPASTCSTGTTATGAAWPGQLVTSASAVPPCTAGWPATTATGSRAWRTGPRGPITVAGPLGRWRSSSPCGGRAWPIRAHGKDKLAVLLRREGLVLSVSMVGLRSSNGCARPANSGSPRTGGSAP